MSGNKQVGSSCQWAGSRIQTEVLYERFSGILGYAMWGLLNLLAKLRVQGINCRCIQYLVSKEQRLVYETFGIALPNV